MRKNSFAFYQNTECEYFPCHSTTHVEHFNCLFCYCPLMFIPNCGGTFKILESGFKDCSNCTRNHDKDAWKFVVSRLREHMQVKVKFNEIKNNV